jgi:hypothetical protein
MEEKNKHRRGKWFAIGLALGIPLGMSIGLAMDNLALGPAIGVVIGAGLGAALERAYRKGDEMETPASERREKTVKAAMIIFLAAGFMTLLLVYFLLRTKR